MKLLKYTYIFLLAFCASICLQAQDLTIFYEISTDGTSVDIYVRNNTGSAIDLGSANFSLAYNSSIASSPTIAYSLISSIWGTGGNVNVNLEDVNFLPQVYDGNTYDKRVWVSSSMPLGGTGVSIPAGGTPTLVMTIVFGTSGGSGTTYYPEDAAEFFGNGFATTSAASVPFNVGPISSFPVEWLDFTATPIREKTVQLDWVTATEENNAVFDIERSADGLHFEMIGELAGAGNSTSARSYTYLDRKANNPVLYYRLRQVDFNGNFSYSEVREVNMDQHFGLVLDVFPNPVANTLTLHMDTDQVMSFELRMQDIAGRTLACIKPVELGGDQEIKLPVSEYANGVYSVELIETKTGTIYSKLFVKE